MIEKNEKTESFFLVWPFQKISPEKKIFTLKKRNRKNILKKKSVFFRISKIKLKTLSGFAFAKSDRGVSKSDQENNFVRILKRCEGPLKIRTPDGEIRNL